MTKLDKFRPLKRGCSFTPTTAIPFSLSRAKACTSSTRTVRSYLDLLSGIGVNALGYAHPAIEEAIARQSRALIHTSNLYFHEGQAELAQRLTEHTGLDRVFFANTGTEAWEGALKLARAHAGLLRSEGRKSARSFLPLSRAFTAAPSAPSPPPIRKSTASPSAPLFPASSL